ncbi:MAG: pilus assembly protein PilZ [Porticoccus sp.]|nr:MAG: pilus assembly protein PilZ [Porticoccus sp.]
MRHFIRHPSDFPILVSSEESSNGDQASPCNISQGGLACQLTRGFSPGTAVTMYILSLQLDYRISGRVTRCIPCAKGFRVGIQFNDKTESFKSRMVEQVCLIEHYRRELDPEGRVLDSEAAAQEWIACFGSQFAKSFSG